MSSGDSNIEPTELRKRTLLGASAGSSGSSTPIQKTDSEINLTKPSLYSIYNENSVLDFNKEEEDDITINVPLVGKAEEDKNTLQREHAPHEHHPVFTVVKLVAKIALLAGSAAIYNFITEQIRNNHISLQKETFEPLYLTQTLITSTIKNFKPLTLLSGSLTNEYANYAIVVTIQGIIMGLTHPLLDNLMDEQYSTRLLSSNPDQKTWRNSNLVNDLLRALITFLGISYAIRNIEWSSSLQVAIIWSMLDPGLWLLLDGTVSGFLAGLVVAIYGCVAVFLTNIEHLGRFADDFIINDYIAIWLWTGSFFFCGLIIFGKIGRALF